MMAKLLGWVNPKRELLIGLVGIGATGLATIVLSDISIFFLIFIPYGLIFHSLHRERIKEDSSIESASSL